MIPEFVGPIEAGFAGSTINVAPAGGRALVAREHRHTYMRTTNNPAIVSGVIHVAVFRTVGDERDTVNAAAGDSSIASQA